MNTMLRIFCLIAVLGLGAPKALALIAVESLVLGDLSEDLVLKRNDPLHAIFKQIQPISMNAADEEKLEYYRAYLNEGLNLKNSCFTKAPIEYPTEWEKEQVMRSLYAQLQYLGLDITVAALARYARFLEFSESEYENMVNNLIENNCSKNISVISIKEIKNNMLLQFKAGADADKLPSIMNSSFFPDRLKRLTNLRESREREMLVTAKMFRSFCSWGGDVNYPRMLTHYLRNPQIVSVLIRQMNGLDFDFSPTLGRVVIKSPTKLNEKEAVYCSQLICRKTPLDFFQENFPRAIGSNSVEDDLKRLYCSDLRSVDNNDHREPSVKVKKWLKTVTLDEENLEIGQFNALMTNIPDFIVGSKNFTDVNAIYRSAFDQAWDDWSEGQIKNLSNDLMFEESLATDLVDRTIFYDPKKGNFSLHFDVNLGEFDKATNINGKIQTKYDLKLKKSFLEYMRRAWAFRQLRRESKESYLLKVMSLNIEESVSKMREGFPIVPWNGDIVSIMARELLDQLELYKGSMFDKDLSGDVQIPIIFSFSPYALKHFHYETKIKKEKAKLDYSSYEYTD
jgi:hypothetical protein